MDVTESSFEHDVIERSKEVPVLVDFWAAWCGPCRSLAPALEAAVAARAGQVELAKVDVDAHPNLSRRFRIQGIPAVKLFRDGKMVAEFTGALSRVKVDAFLDGELRPVEEPVAGEYEKLLDELRESKRCPGVLEALQLGYHDQALAQLIEDLEVADSSEERDEMRRMMLVIFDHLGSDHPLSQRYRRMTAAVLY